MSVFYLIEQVKFWQLLADVDLLYFHRGQPGWLNCANCDTQTTEAVLRNHAIRKTLLHGCDKSILLA